MAIYKRGSTWTVRVWIKGRKVERAVGPDRAAALIVQKEMDAALALSRAAGTSEAAYKLLKAREKKTVREAFADYMRLREATIKPSTKRTYMENFNAHVNKRFGDVQVSSITKYDLADFQNDLAAHCTATRTNNVVNLLRSILKHCVHDDLIPISPARALRSLREEEANIAPLTLEELEIALNAIPEFYRPIFNVLAWSGMRPNEVKALRRSDIDWRRNEIKISRDRVKGVESTVKTRSSKRILPMHPRVRAAFEWQKTSGLKNIQDHVFTSKKGQPINQHLDVLWSAALRRAGLRHRPCYQLRHTWASMALQAGETPGWVARMMGHNNLATLLRHYARFIPSDRDGLQIAKIAAPS